MWNNEYLFVGCDGIIKLIYLKNGINIKNLIGHNNTVFCIKKIFINSYYGECLISQGCFNDQIKLWVNKNWNINY